MLTDGRTDGWLLLSPSSRLPQNDWCNFQILQNPKCYLVREGERVMVVAVNHENDTCFENGLVIGYAGCKYSAGLVETPKVALKVVLNISLALCQTHCKQVPVFSRLSKSH